MIATTRRIEVTYRIVSQGDQEMQEIDDRVVTSFNNFLSTWTPWEIKTEAKGSIRQENYMDVLLLTHTARSEPHEV